MSTPSNGLGLTPDLRKEVDKASQKRLRHWFDALEREGHTVLRVSVFRTALLALVGWGFVAFIVMVFIVTPQSAWNPFSGEYRVPDGWLTTVLALFFLLALLLFGAGALLSTFVYPFARPRLEVSWWGVRSVWWTPGGEREIFSAPWSDVVAVGGSFTSTRWPFPDVLHVTITARSNGAPRVRRRRRVRHAGGNVVHDVDWMLQGRHRDVLAFLAQVHAIAQAGPARH